VEPEAKVEAAAVVEALGTTVPGGSAAAARLRAIDADPALARQAGALLPPASPAVVEIVYPQYGGLTTREASVMTVARQWWIENDDVRDRAVTTDIRLTRDDGRWSVTQLRPVPATDPSELELPAQAAALAMLPGVDLPAAALADLADGVVQAVVIDALIELAEEFELSVCVFRSGHPENVFGTNRVSNHTQGRAVDVWAIDGRPVVTMDAADPTLLRFIEAARDAGGTQIGGPVDLDGPGGVHFTDHVHQDHVHIGFRV
jgi:hypothetical protein